MPASFAGRLDKCNAMRGCRRSLANQLLRETVSCSRRWSCAGAHRGRRCARARAVVPGTTARIAGDALSGQPRAAGDRRRARWLLPSSACCVGAPSPGRRPPRARCRIRRGTRSARGMSYGRLAGRELTRLAPSAARARTRNRGLVCRRAHFLRRGVLAREPLRRALEKKVVCPPFRGREIRLQPRTPDHASCGGASSRADLVGPPRRSRDEVRAATGSGRSRARASRREPLALLDHGRASGWGRERRERKRDRHRRDTCAGAVAARSLGAATSRDAKRVAAACAPASAKRASKRTDDYHSSSIRPTSPGCRRTRCNSSSTTRRTRGRKIARAAPVGFGRAAAERQRLSIVAERRPPPPPGGEQLARRRKERVRRRLRYRDRVAGAREMPGRLAQDIAPALSEHDVSSGSTPGRSRGAIAS